MVIAGARPNFIKIAPLLRALRIAGAEAKLVHTGQHYDPSMSGTFFDQLQIQPPDFSLEVGAGSHAQQTARIMTAFEPVVLSEKPDWVVVVGDVNSTLACALVVSKLRADLGVRIAHVEAGLRSNDWRMPEEVNRVLTDRLSDLLLTPSRDASRNLLSEGIEARRIHFVGNIMIDTLFTHVSNARKAAVADQLGLPPRGYALVTLHRPSNVDDPVALSTILQGLNELHYVFPVVFPLHPRTRQSAERFGLVDSFASLQILKPLGYVEMLSLMSDAAVVLTDSGGVQEETTAIGVPCVTLRQQTERPITVAEGTNRLVTWPMTPNGIVRAAQAASAERPDTPPRPDGWDGHAAERIVDAMIAA